jgi:insulysin
MNIDIIKPINDNRNYKYYILENNIKCILINDKLLDKSIVVSSINVGSFADKDYYDGMAHLLEHMCFITSKKYKIKNYLSNKISESGGSVNAFTDNLNTVYYFDIFTENLESILEIFVDFLFNAELNKNYILDELNNVDSEHRKNINDDGWRLHNLERILANEESNYNHFSTGTKETLNKSDIYEKMVDFYNKYYNSDNISISIASNKSINDLYKIVNKYFGKIKKSKENIKCKLIKPIYTKNKGKTFLMKSINDIKILEYIFEIKNFDINSKIYNLFSNILNTSEKNSLNDNLKSQGLINDINSYFDLNGLFKISIILTDNGLNKINEINNYIINTVNKIFLMDWKEILKYNKNKFTFLFNNLKKIETMSLCIDFLQKLLYYKPSNIYYADFNYENNSLSSNNLRKILEENINFDNCLRIIVNKKLNTKNKILIDKYYGTKYCELINFWNRKEFIINIDYNINNKYSTYKPIINNSDNEIPKLINKNIWYGSTIKFNELLIYCNIIFSNKNYFNNIKNYLLTECSIEILNYYLYKELYKAFEYNYSAKILMVYQINSLILELVFYDINFINDVLILLNNKINVSDELILSKILLIKDNLESIKYINPWSYCDYIFENSYENFYHYTDLLKELNNIKIEEIKEYMNNIIKKCYTKIFIYGNLKIKDTSFIQLKNNIFNFKTIYKFPKIKLKKYIKIKHPNNNEKENCVKISYFTSKFNNRKNLYLIFIKLISYNLFFDDLRTKQKLGYLVTMYSSNIRNEYYIYQKIQSKLPCKEIINHINKFNDSLIENIKTIDLNKWKETVINYLNKKENNTEELINKYYIEILNNTFIFNKNKLLLKYINEITIKSLCKFIDKYIINNKCKNIIEIYT